MLLRSVRALIFVCAVAVLVPFARAQEAPSTDGPGMSMPTIQRAHPATDMKPGAPPQAIQPPAPVQRAAPLPPPPPYDPAIFTNAVPTAQLAFLQQFNGAPSAAFIHDKQVRKLLKNFLPDCMYHYGRDMPLTDAVTLALDNSLVPVQIRDNRYLTASGRGPILGGGALLWIDLQTGIGAGAFFFRPTNGEPTPALTVFSRQIREDGLSQSQLPPAFGQDARLWQERSGVPAVVTSYFITGTNHRILFEHDTDFCSPADGSIAPSGADCDQMNADAADVDLTAAYYLEQVQYATNATAYMIHGDDETAFLRVRTRTCADVADPLGCHIRLTREHTHVVLGHSTRIPRRG